MLSKRPKLGEVYYGPSPEDPRKSWFFEVTSVGSREVFVCSASWNPRARLPRERRRWSVPLDFFVVNYRLERDHRGGLVRRPGDSTVRAKARQAAVLKRTFDGSLHGK